MKKTMKVLFLAFLMLFILNYVGLAEDLNKLTDRFYTGLADIIEGNMDSPNECVRAVDKYYLDNQALVGKMRQATKEAMEEATPMIEKMINKYESMSEEELEALEKQYQGMEQEMSKKQIPAGAARYTELLQTFTMKYPKYGMEITMRAMQLMPKMDKGSFWEDNR
jgi:protein subunit release factor A